MVLFDGICAYGGAVSAMAIFLVVIRVYLDAAEWRRLEIASACVAFLA
jgi:hypothetical protein